MNVFSPKLQCRYIFDFIIFAHILIFLSISFSSFLPLEKRVHVIFYALFFKNICFYPFYFPFSHFIILYCCRCIFYLSFSLFYSCFDFYLYHFSIFLDESKTFLLFFMLYFLKIFIFFSRVFLFLYFVIFHCRLYIFSLRFPSFYPLFDFCLCHFNFFFRESKTSPCHFSCSIF